MVGNQINGASAPAETRPLRGLLLLMPHLQIRTECHIDYESADPALLHQLGSNADQTMRTVHQGLAAIGRLLAYTSPEVCRGEFSADSTEALGWLLAELGDLAATAHSIATSCQRYTADYSPGTPKHIPNARP